MARAEKNIVWIIRICRVGREFIAHHSSANPTQQNRDTTTQCGGRWETLSRMYSFAAGRNQPNQTHRIRTKNRHQQWGSARGCWYGIKGVVQVRERLKLRRKQIYLNFKSDGLWITLTTSSWCLVGAPSLTHRLIWGFCSKEKKHFSSRLWMC